jgi:UDP-glucose 4-epimerase
MSILVTGGSGYIGSHTVLSLLEKGFEVVVLDNLVNSSKESLARVEKLTGKTLTFYEGDIADEILLNKIFNDHAIDCVIHFAALKAVGESTKQPYRYYKNNVLGTLNLLETMYKNEINNFIFSSSATVYGEENKPPYVETQPLGNPTSPYGTTKLTVEKIMQDAAKAYPKVRMISLRYFNPIGAHISGDIGEDPNGPPNNLVPYITQVAVGKRASLQVFGNNYNTKDGTCERDYLHVEDLAEGHVAALEWLEATSLFTGFETFNLGTGNPVSVTEIINKFESVTGVKIAHEYVDRRDGDLPAFWANCEKANHVLDWFAKRTLEDMLSSAWEWQRKNPDGYCYKN